MSEIPIQDSPEPEQGAQTPLATDSRRGNENLAQNNLSFCRGVEVPASSGTSDAHFGSGLHAGKEMNGISPRPASPTTSGMTVDGRAAEHAKPTDRKTLEGSTPGDFRAKAADAKLPDNPPVRSGMGQAKMCSSKLDSNLPQASSAEVVD